MDGVMDESSIVYISIVRYHTFLLERHFSRSNILCFETLKACVKDTSSDILDATKREALPTLVAQDIGRLKGRTQVRNLEVALFRHPQIPCT
jgi:hypothetical protein